MEARRSESQGLALLHSELKTFLETWDSASKRGETKTDKWSSWEHTWQGRRPERAKEESQKLDLKKWTQLCYSSRTPWVLLLHFLNGNSGPSLSSKAAKKKQLQLHSGPFNSVHFHTQLKDTLCITSDLGIWEFLQETFCCCFCYEKITRYSASEFLPSLAEAGNMVLKRIHGRLVLWAAPFPEQLYHLSWVALHL